MDLICSPKKRQLPHSRIRKMQERYIHIILLQAPADFFDKKLGIGW